MMLASQKFFVLCGVLGGFLGVLLGAFGAHALRQKLSADLLSVFEVGVRYQMYHALTLFLVAWLYGYFTNGYVFTSGCLFIAGILIFSGSLYCLALTGIRIFGAVTPIGGVTLLAGWFFLALGMVIK